MHHTVPIGAVTVQAPSHIQVGVPTMKGPDDARFCETLSASLKTTGVATDEEQQQPRHDGSEAKPARPNHAEAVAKPSTNAAKGEDSRLVDTGDEAQLDVRLVVRPEAPIPAAVVPGSEVVKQATAAIPPQTVVPAAAKKSPHKDAETVSTTAQATVTEGTPAVAAPVVIAAQASVAIPVPVNGSANVNPEPQVPSGVAGPKSLPPVSAVRGLRQDAKKAESPPASSATTKPEAVAAIAIAPPVASHDSRHAGNGVEPQAVATTAATGLHGATQSEPVAAGKISDRAIAVVPQANGSTATDLKTLVATPNVLEVGIASGSHGWLRVRAELGQTGEVAASVVAASAGAAQALHKELPAISAYLAGERVGVSSLAINAADKGSTAPDAALSGGTASSDPGSNRRSKDVQPSESISSSGASATEPGVGFDAVGIHLPSVGANGSGGWLSVRV